MSNFFDELGTGSLLKNLEAAQKELEKIHVPGAEPEITGFVEQIDDLVAIIQSFDDLATKERRHPSVHLNVRSSNALLQLRAVLTSAAAVIDECDPFVRPLQSSLEVLRHERDTAGYLASEHHLKNKAWYEETYQSLRLFTAVLQTLFTATTLLQFQDESAEEEHSLKGRFSTANALHYQIGLAEEKLHSNEQNDSHIIQEAIKAAKAVTIHVPAMPNQHFVLPRQVRTYYTGREAQLAKLEAAFRDPTQPTQQVFVVYGLSGSGKTELVFKYAEEHRHKFWGVFYVDGSSQKHASSSYATIATLGGVAPNEKAAKHWLATRELPWLLVIDNVDEEKIKIEELLPHSAKGCCVITTRNPVLTTYGTAGDRHLELLPMKSEEAETLIITAADEPRPWTTVVTDSAKAICNALGNLPLALEQAAKAIRTAICQWDEYLVYFDRQIRRVRRNLHGRSKSRSRERGQVQEDKSSISVFSTYEILYESLESSPKETYQDAIELLHVFSYFHFQNIRLDVLVQSAINPLKDEAQQREDELGMKTIEQKLDKPPRKPLYMRLRELRAYLRSKVAIPTPLPNILRNPLGLSFEELEEDVDVRLRHAIGVLIERSLVMRQDRATKTHKGTVQYSMHRLVHKWVRERTEMSTSHQALWCQISMTTLACSIRRPPHGDSQTEIRIRRELLPHVRHVCEQQKEIEHRLAENEAGVRRAWKVAKSYGRHEVEQDVRFWRIYGETGHFNEDLILGQRALDFVAGRLGPDHPIAIQLSLLVSHTLWEMSEMDVATRRQRQTLQLCVNTWGEYHPLTLEVTDLLGSALYFKGRWREAQALHTGNTEKLTRLYGEQHLKTLKSIRNTARLLYRWMEYDEATKFYQIAHQGTKEQLSETHLETLFCLEDLAMSYIRYEEGSDSESDSETEPPLKSDDDTPNEARRKAYAALSHTHMQVVYQHRKDQLGAEHHYTLLALLFLARTKSELGNHVEAESMIRSGLQVAQRNIPQDHIAFTLANTIYAQVLSRLKKYDEAEQLYSTLVDKETYRKLADEDGDHPDRLTALLFLAKCLEEQGRFKEALKRYEELEDGLSTIGGKGAGRSHKILSKALRKIATLRARVGETDDDDAQSDRSTLVGD